MKTLLTLLTLTFTTASAQQIQKGNFSTFLPKGYVITDTITGDLNKDGIDDYVLIIKATDKSKIVNDKDRGKLDRNRRGIICVASKNGHYEVMAKNYNCFSSENEDGGVYYAPELDVQIRKGNLHISYEHGRYGYWRYTFRYQNSDFELIGFDASDNHGPIVNTETSINFLTKKKITKENTNEDPNQESGQETFKTTTTHINASKLIQLSKVVDFDELSVSGD